MHNEKKIKVIDRLLEYLKVKEIAPTRFEKNIGLSNGYLRTQQKRNADLGESILNKIIDNCLDVNPIWLIFGKGEMLKSYQNTETIVNDVNSTYKKQSDCKQCEIKDRFIEELLKQIDVKDRQINKLLEKIETHCEQDNLNDKKRNAS